MQQSFTKEVENYTFIVPGEGLAFEQRDSLVDACMSAIRKNMTLLGMDAMTVPYKVKFYPSKAAMKEDVGFGFSGHADYWNKEVGFVVTDDPAVIEAENIIPAPIAHETMHMVAMEQWGFPPENNIWLNEGLATYAANQCNGYTVREVYSHLLDQGMMLPIDSLLDGFYTRDEMIAYHQAACIVQYLLEHHDLEQLQALWVEGADQFEQIYGSTYQELAEQINADIKAAYPEGVAIDWETFKKGCK